MGLTTQQKADIRAARSAYMREYRKKKEFKEWQYEYNRRPETKQIVRKSNERYWLNKADEMKKAGVL